MHSFPPANDTAASQISDENFILQDKTKTTEAETQRKGRPQQAKPLIGAEEENQIELDRSRLLDAGEDSLLEECFSAEQDAEEEDGKIHSSPSSNKTVNSAQGSETPQAISSRSPISCHVNKNVTNQMMAPVWAFSNNDDFSMFCARYENN